MEKPIGNTYLGFIGDIAYGTRLTIENITFENAHVQDRAAIHNTVGRLSLSDMAQWIFFIILIEMKKDGQHHATMRPARLKILL